MKKSPILTLIALFGAAVIQAFAAETPTQATVQKISGANARVKLSPADEPRTLAEGEKLPQGATVLTGAGTEVFISAMDGSVTSIRQNSEVQLEKLSVTREGGTVTKQSALLNLKTGNVVSTIDPTKKAINDYKVSTPRGVAAARGTTYTVSLAGGVYLVTVLNGNVSVQPPGGAPAISVISGQATTGGTAQPLASVTGVAATVMQEVVSAAVSAVAAVAAAPNLAAASGMDSTAVTNLLQTTVQTVVKDAPAQVATNAIAQAAAAVASVPGQGANATSAMTTLVQTAVSAAATSTSSTTPSVANIVQAASQGAATTAANTNAASTNATTIATAAAKGVSGTSQATSTVATAIAAAVVQGTQTGAANNTVSTQVANSAQTVATTVQTTVANTVQTNVTPPAGSAPITVTQPSTPTTTTPPPAVTTPPVNPDVNVSRSS